MVILLWTCMGTSCCYDSSEASFSFPIGIRAKKKKLQPPYEFASAIVDYKKQKGFWPVSETALRSANQDAAIEKLYGDGFLS